MTVEDERPEGGGDGDIAIIGMAVRFPGAETLDRFWDIIRTGAEGIRDFSVDALIAQGVDPAVARAERYVRRGAVLDAIDRFDAAFFGLSPREAELMDPQHRLFLECAWEALEHAGHDRSRQARTVGVYAGTSLSTYLLFNLLEQPSIRQAADTFPFMVGNDKDFLCTRVSYHLNLRGPSVDVQSGCSTSLVAVHLACEALIGCQCDVALAGGVSVNVPQRTGYLFQEGGVTSPDGRCRPFDAQGQGTIFGSGAGIVVLKRAAEAIADGDTVYALIKGSAINNDGSTKVGYTAPSVDGQAEVIARAQAVAGVTAREIGYIETHGTGTALGDPVELEALTKAFRTTTEARGFCAIGAVKANIGHLDAAAGVAGLIKTVLALHHRCIPPLANYTAPNPEIDFAASPFYVPTSAIEWPAVAGAPVGTGGDTSKHPRRAGVSSFGIGGTNAHIVLEEAGVPEVTNEAVPEERSAPQLLVVSARTATALETATMSLTQHLRQHPELHLADVAHTLQTGRQPFGHRAALVVSAGGAADTIVSRMTTSVAAASALGGVDITGAGGASGFRADSVGTSGETDTTGATGSAAVAARWMRAARTIENRQVAFLFPGQGAQHVRMGLGIYRREPVFREQLDRCAQLAAPLLGRDLVSLIFPDDSATAAADALLRGTDIAQPALFSVEYALAQLWMSWGIRPVAMLGHSLGELTAACLAGVLDLSDAVALVVLRGRLMASVPPGSMLAVALPEEELGPWLSGDGVSLAARNHPHQCVLSGEARAIDAVAEQLAARGVTVHRLGATRAFHSRMMDGILPAFEAQVARLRLRAPAIPCISNVTGTWLTPAEAIDPRYWARHLRATVRFADGAGLLLRDTHALLEAGPGQTLTTIVRAHPERRGDQPVIASLGARPAEEGDAIALASAVGQLWTSGVAIDWHARQAGARHRRVPLPTYPFERQRFWIDPQKGPAPASRETTRAAEIDDWFYTPSWRRTLPVAPPAPDEAVGGERWLVFGDDGALTAAIVRALRARGDAPIVVAAGERFVRVAPDRFQVRADSRDDYVRLLRAVDGDDDTVGSRGTIAPVGRVLHLWSALLPLGSGRSPDRGLGQSHSQSHSQNQSHSQRQSQSQREGAVEEGFAQAQQRGLYSLLPLIQAIAAAAPPRGERARPIALWVAGAGLHDVVGAERLCPEQATLLGLCDVVPQERPEIECRVIDLDADVAAALRSQRGEASARSNGNNSLDGEARTGAGRDGHDNTDGNSDGHGVGAIDSIAGEVASLIVAEITSHTPARRVAYRGGQRWLPGFERVRLAPETTPAPTNMRVNDEHAVSVVNGESDQSDVTGVGAVNGERSESIPFQRDRTYLIAGGLGAIGLALAEHLVTIAGARVVLLQRSALPDRGRWHEWLATNGGEDGRVAGSFTQDSVTQDDVRGKGSGWIRRTLQRLLQSDPQGDRLLIVQADLGDRRSLVEALAAAEARFGPLHGVMHAAGISGVAAFQTVDETDAAACARQFRAKVQGLRHLDDWLGDRRLDFRILFSSNAAILGGPGLLGYAAAHRFMDTFAADSLRRPGRAWLAIDWDAWIDPDAAPRGGSGSRGDGASAVAGASAVPAVLAAPHALTVPQGLDALRRVLARTRAGQVVVSSGDLDARIAAWVARTPSPAAPTDAAAHARPALAVDYLEPESDLERTVAGIWQTTLRLDRIGLDDNFFELGGSSLLGAEIIRQVRSTIGHDVPIVRLFEQPTVRTFAASLTSAPADPHIVAAPRSARGERRRGLLQQKEWHREHA